MKYTEHELTDPMLQRLSKITKGRPCGGVSIVALEARGLIEENPQWQRVVGRGWPTNIPQHLATDAGRAALAKARQEGW